MTALCSVPHEQISPILKSYCVERSSFVSVFKVLHNGFELGRIGELLELVYHHPEALAVGCECRLLDRVVDSLTARHNQSEPRLRCLRSAVAYVGIGVVHRDGQQPLPIQDGDFLQSDVGRPLEEAVV